LPGSLGVPLEMTGMYRVLADMKLMLFSYRESFPEGVSCSLLVNLTIEFFNTEPSVKEKLANYSQKMSLKAQVKMI
jgi:hypothetical protein